MPAAQDVARTDVREVPIPGTATGFHDVEIEVVDADGRPAGDAEVYALPVGAPGVDDPDPIPCETAGEDGRCRLRLPSPGTFDVVARARYVLARIEGVPVPGTGSLRLALPRTAAATFVVDPESPPTEDVEFQVWAVARPGVRAFPARSEALSVSSWGGMVGAGHPRHELPLGPMEFEVAQAPRAVIRNGVLVHEPRERPAVFEPERFVPPATIRVRAFDPAAPTLEVALKLVEPAQRASSDREVLLRLEFEDEVVEQPAWISWNRRSPAVLTIRRRVRTPTGMLRWSGPAVVPGAARWDLAGSQRLDATVEVRPPAAADGVRVLVELPADDPSRAGLDEGRAVLHFLDSYDPERTDRALVPVGEEVPLDVPGEWLLADVDPGEGPMLRRVAGPLRFRRGDRAVLRPRPGGYVVFAPASAPPEGAGAPVVARADGAPFPYSQQGDDGHGHRVELVPGAVLGPFEPGTVTLDVFVGGLRWGRYEVSVRENAWTAFAPRPFR